MYLIKWIFNLIHCIDFDACSSDERSEETVTTSDQSEPAFDKGDENGNDDFVLGDNEDNGVNEIEIGDLNVAEKGDKHEGSNVREDNIHDDSTNIIAGVSIEDVNGDIADDADEDANEDHIKDVTNEGNIEDVNGESFEERYQRLFPSTKKR